MDLKELGFDGWFEARAAGLAPEGCGFARVSAVDRGAFMVRNVSGEMPARLSGRFEYQAENSADLPCVGDWVVVQAADGDSMATIRHVLPRRTFLRRKTPGRNVGFQMIAANIDRAYVVQSCHFDFNPNRLERYLVMATDGGVEPVVVLTKTDLVTPEELEQMIGTIQSVTRARIIAISSVTGAGLDEFSRELTPGTTCCLLGSSGVGKTTLINRLLGQEAFETRAVSRTGEGTHTTSRRQLILLAGGAMLVDTPGMRELGIVGTGEGVEAGFEGLGALAGNCRYADCSHQHEPGCAVRAAVENGQLDADRYSNYLKLRKESEFHEMSVLEKRRKDKAFGRFIKSAKKQLRGK